MPGNKIPPHQYSPIDFPSSHYRSPAWDAAFGPARQHRPSAKEGVPVNISPRGGSIPESLRYIGTIVHAPFKSSFFKTLARESDFFGSCEDEVELEPFVGDCVLQWDVSRRDIVNAPFLIYDEHGLGLSEEFRLAKRGEIGTRVQSIAPNTLLLVRLIGEEHFRASSCQELLAPTLPTYRFVYSILVNSERYLAPLLEAAIGEECEVRVTWGGSSGPEFMVYLPTSPEHRSAPLLDLAGSTPFNLLKAIALADDDEAASLVQFIDAEISSVSLGDFIHANYIVGTGKYPPLDYEETFKRMLLALLNLGLVRRDSNAIVLADAGARLLDILPHRLFDPDMRLRWFDRANDLIGPEYAESSERWLRSYYGIMRKAALRHGVRREWEFGDLTNELVDELVAD
ncbi:hypothetical protein [Rhizobium sp. BK176]|uniref:hypothetical protein n=1 Tax=Rhizobium sp. BK176 TaxID=2587071 RepID=UPI002166E0E6|nr:hypothetical protein [Rhizobium sp. BK176]MCS4090209.1 hypothetical protein [Rhizobium sp. BK176]